MHAAVLLISSRIKTVTILMLRKSKGVIWLSSFWVEFDPLKVNYLGGYQGKLAGKIGPF